MQLCSEDALPPETWILVLFFPSTCPLAAALPLGSVLANHNLLAPLRAPDSSIYVFESCIAESNTTNYVTGYGFDIFNLTDSKIINCFAEGNNIGINVSDFTLPPATNEFGSANNIFRGNVVSANTAFGIQDTTSAKSNAYYSNQAKNNGPTPATTNYSGAGIFPVPSCSTTTLCCTPANLTPVLYWTLPNAPCTLNTNCVVSTPLDNLSIVN